MIVYTNDQHYSDIADAIREKTGDSEAEYLPSEMAEAIENIPSGGGGLPKMTDLLSITMTRGE